MAVSQLYFLRLIPCGYCCRAAQFVVNSHIRPVIDSKVDSGELLYPSSLLAVEDFCGGQVLDVLVVRVHLYLLSRSFTIPSPVLEGVHYREKFFVVDFIVYFRWLELA